MKNLKKTRRIQIILLAFLFLGVSVSLIGYGFKDGINFFRAPAQVMADPPQPTETFRLGGLVEIGSIVRGQGETITFRVTDGAATVPVAFTGILPDLFTENTGMVGTGKLIDGVFVAEEILAKHDETYMPSEVVDALKAQGMYQDPNG
ncbi:cytochrome c-type biogenesis protein CcmE [Pseudorhodobacter antarcticus]|jgi:cytochrome c-type biogenesis protein CcmE|uniref:Cytochrome c-type biogenesis protein CcmE n=1 Tax=Pseudorhodobacter antarcticus TaxID=1077947 RepID=A0A1H8BMH3_9RHOB|nr:cytochrome c maturation protein CcmE [Pseudorhodobacter antarcticus]SEM83983.1 cytochrome c-type biogenesis protein CcmE [Pseudorhodobacter antarcticus]